MFYQHRDKVLLRSENVHISTLGNVDSGQRRDNVDPNVEIIFGKHLTNVGTISDNVGRKSHLYWDNI